MDRSESRLDRKPDEPSLGMRSRTRIAAMNGCPALPADVAETSRFARVIRTCLCLISRPAVAMALMLLASTAAGASIPELLQRTRWGADSDTLAREFGDRATMLPVPIEFGDSHVEVVLRNEEIGGYPFTVYFQMDNATGGLKRIHLERQRHGAVLGVYRAVLDELEASYGSPARVCAIPPTGAHGYQRAETRLWRLDGTLLRATFRDTTLGASEACLSSPPPCRPTGQLFLQIAPPEAIPDPCG